MGNMGVLVSVIVITYNQELYIERCLSSIVNQKFDFRFEVLVGDDASNDNTTTKVLCFARKYPLIVKPIIRQVNIGATKNILDLINRAKGKYLAFCEGDDFWNDNMKLSIQHQFMKEHKDFIGCVHDILLVDELENTLSSQKVSWINSKKVNRIEAFDGHEYPGHLSTLFVKNFNLKEYKFLDVLFTHRNLSDRMLFLLFLSRGNIGYINGIMSSYRYMRGYNNNNFIALNRLENVTNCKRDMYIFNSMELWLKKDCGIKKYFVPAQSRILVTALFHQIKGYNVTFFDVWKMCNHKYLAFLRFPIAFIEQLIKKIKVVLGLELR